MGNSQSSDSSSGSSSSNSWEYTPSDGGNGTTSDAVWQGAKQGFKEFFEAPGKEHHLDHHPSPRLQLTTHP